MGLDPVTMLAGSGAISGISSLFGGILGSNAASQAAQTQATAANNASQLQNNMFKYTSSLLSPFVSTGQNANDLLYNNILTGQIGSMPTTWGMSTQFAPTMADLEKTPGYQFTRQQGLQAVTNSYAAQGLGGSITGGRAGPSGPLAAGLTQFATGLASNTFNQQYQNWLAGQQLQLGQQTQRANILSGIAGMGENAAAGVGNQGVSTGNSLAGLTTSAGAALAGGQVGSANALIGAGSGVAGAANNTALLLALQNSGMFGGSTAGLAGLKGGMGTDAG